MQNCTVELTGTNNKSIQNTNEQMQRRKVHLGILNAMVKYNFQS